MEIKKENTMEIAQTDNGYILQEYFWEDSTKSGEKIIGSNTFVFEEDYNDDKKSLIDLLFKVAETLGFSYDKYGKENLNITFDKKGHKLYGEINIGR